MRLPIIVVILFCLNGCAFFHSLTEEGMREEMQRYQDESAERDRQAEESSRAQEKRDREIREEKNRQRREAFIRAHPRISKVKQEAILKGEVFAGMTSDQVVASWGEPEKNNRTVGAWGVHEQWVYGRTYLYFRGGVMSSFQDSK
jgi:predicted Holliday junction resolvase-like endonuclease